MWELCLTCQTANEPEMWKIFSMWFSVPVLPQRPDLWRRARPLLTDPQQWGDPPQVRHCLSIHRRHSELRPCLLDRGALQLTTSTQECPSFHPDPPVCLQLCRQEFPGRMSYTHTHTYLHSNVGSAFWCDVTWSFCYISQNFGCWGGGRCLFFLLSRDHLQLKPDICIHLKRSFNFTFHLRYDFCICEMSIKKRELYIFFYCFHQNPKFA